MTPAELLAIARFELTDEEEPYGWTDAYLYGCMDEAQKQFCRLAYGIQDARSFKLNLRAGSAWYDIDPQILQIRRAKDDRGRDLSMITMEKAATLGYDLSDTPGTTRALITGAEKNAVRAASVPNNPSIVSLLVFRLPETIPVTGKADFEIDEQHHRPLLHWVKHLAYGVPDTEYTDKQRAMNYAAEFRNYCRDAKAEWERLNRPMGGTVMYGGI